MGIRNAKTITFRPHGLTDAVDGTNAVAGSMKSLENLIPAPSTPGVFVPRPAGASVVDLAAHFTTPTNITAAEVVGNKVYGFVSSADFAGKDVPFIYDLSAGAYVAIAGLAAGLLPTSPAATGDWTPPTIAVISNSCVVFTHPGFAGGSVCFGWLDTSSFTLTTMTGTTAIGSPIITATSTNPINAGVEPGMTITGAGIPAGAYILSMTATTITISANCTAAAAGVALNVAGGTVAAPRWGAGNTNTNALASVPTSAVQFGGRCYFAVGNGVVLSDVLRPRQVSAASQALILGDDQPVTALAVTPLNTPLTGGVLSSLYAFKAGARVFQITGDPVTANLVQSEVNGSVGTFAPLTLCATPEGIAYVAPDGVRLINLQGQCMPPLGGDGDGVRVPFWTALYPSRMCAAFQHNVLRVSLQDSTLAGIPWTEYWFDFGRKVWTGPHTNAAQLVSGWPNAALTDFVYVPQAHPTQLWSNSVVPTSTSTYSEAGVQLDWTYETTLLPDNQEMAENQVIETTIMLSLPLTESVLIYASNESGTPLDYVPMIGNAAAAAVWGAFTWGAARWGAGPILCQYQVAWSEPIVFKQLRFRVQGASGPSVAIGNMYAKYQTLGYVLDPALQI